MGIPVYKRLELLLEHLEISQKQLGELAGLSENTISNAKKGKNIPGIDFFNSLYKNIPDLNPSWLYMGEGKMLLNGESPAQDHPLKIQRKDNLSLEECKKMIALLEAEILNLKIQLKDKDDVIHLLKNK
jgi:transcriptional regulator with XRE-family HTH domain